MNNIYREEILEHYKNPLNFGKLNKFTISSKQLNPFCGDEIEIFVEFVKDKVRKISFRGKGCAISIASVSMLTEYVKEKTKKELTKFKESDMLELIGIQISLNRKKCALLGWAVLQDCLDSYVIQSKS